jgi:hypothetical protein
VNIHPSKGALFDTAPLRLDFLACTIVMDILKAGTNQVQEVIPKIIKFLSNDWQPKQVIRG